MRKSKYSEVVTVVDEYPLMYQEAVDLCKSARYVGGTSRYLCECIQPLTCKGVQKAKQMFDSLDVSGANND